MPLLTLLIFTGTLEAGQGAGKELWTFGSQSIELQRDPIHEGLFSSICFRSDSCLAMKAMKVVSKIKLTTQALRGGKNPGSVLCTRLSETFKDTQVVFGENASGNFSSFCHFSDGSLVSSGALMNASRGAD